MGGVVYPVGTKRKRENGEALYNTDTIAVGGSVTIADLTWTRIEGLPEDSRTEPHQPTTFKTNLFHDGTREIDVFEALMPLSKEALLKIVRENAEEINDAHKYELWMIGLEGGLFFQSNPHFIFKIQIYILYLFTLSTNVFILYLQFPSNF